MTTLFVNLPVKDVQRSTTFFTSLGLQLFGAMEDMAAVAVSEQAQVMLLGKKTFASYTRNEVADPGATTQAILVLGVDNRAAVDELVEKAVAAGGTAIGEARDDGFRYQRAFADLDGHHWEALCLAQPSA